jgi:Papain family cysteine protease
MPVACSPRQSRLRWRTVALGVVLTIFVTSTARGVEPLPREVSLIADLQKDDLPAVAQGDRDVCSLFAVTGVAEFEVARQAAAPCRRLSEEYLIWAADKATGLTGDQAMFYKAVDGLNGLGICSAERMPYAAKPDPKRKPSSEAVAEARDLRERWQVHWLKRWSLNCPLTEQQLTDIKRALAEGHPVACGLRWPNTLKGSQLLDVPPANKVSDGHSIMFVGYQDDPTKKEAGVLRFRNSWGPGWGDHGYGTMSYAYARAYANDALWLQLGPPKSELPTMRFEAESMPVLAKERCNVNSQKMNDFSAAMWSGGAQLFCAAEKGGFVELGFDVHQPGRYRLRALATAAPDFGKVRAALDGRSVAQEFDLYSGRVSPAGSLELGTYDFPSGRHRLRFTAAVKNAVSTNFSFGIDCVDLISAK